MQDEESTHAKYKDCTGSKHRPSTSIGLVIMQVDKEHARKNKKNKNKRKQQQKIKIIVVLSNLSSIKFFLFFWVNYSFCCMSHILLFIHVPVPSLSNC